MRKLNVAVIGCGAVSCMHLDSAVALEQANLVAVCDEKADKANATAQKYGVHGYTDYKEMFAKEQLDAVHLCLPHYLHIPVARYALEQGVHVLSEKPMSIGFEEAAETVDLAERMGLQYGVIFQCRYNTPAQFVKQDILNGRLGAVKCGRVVLTWYRPDNYYSDSDWKGTWDKEGGGVIIDQAIHSIDLANWFIGAQPVSVQSSLHNRHHNIMVVEDTAEGLVEYNNGALLSFFAMNNYCIDEPIEICLVCENGIVRLSYNEATILYNDGTSKQIENAVQKIVSYSGGKDYWGTGHVLQINQFYNAVLGLEELEISGAEALKTHKIICDIYKNDDMRYRENGKA